MRPEAPRQAKNWSSLAQPGRIVCTTLSRRRQSACDVTKKMPRFRGLFVRATTLSRPFHLAGGRQCSVFPLDSAFGVDSHPGAFDVVLDTLAAGLQKACNEQRLDQLMVVGAHFDFAGDALVLHAFERLCDFGRIG